MPFFSWIPSPCAMLKFPPLIVNPNDQKEGKTRFEVEEENEIKR
jgi:hypothetical protein